MLEMRSKASLLQNTQTSQLSSISSGEKSWKSSEICLFSLHERRRQNYDFPDSRPIRRSKNFAELTSTATLALGTNLSRTTGEVRVLASVGAEPRMDILRAAGSFFIPGRRCRSPAS